MSHLHIPDGVLPAALWASGLALALAVLLLCVRLGRGGSPREVAYRGALGGLMLAVMSIPVPLFAMEYCLTLAGPLGVLVGGAAGFQVVFIVSVILALLGQGGFTVIGLNALVMGAGAAVARPLYRRAAARLGPAWALAWATAGAQLVSGALWFAVLALALRLSPGLELARGDHAGHAGVAGRHAVFAGVTVALWGVAIFAEAAVAFGIGRFLGRVRPDLLPGPADARALAGEGRG